MPAEYLFITFVIGVVVIAIVCSTTDGGGHK